MSKQSTEFKNVFNRASLPSFRVWISDGENWKDSAKWGTIEEGNGHYWDPQKLSEPARKIIYSLVAEVERLRQEKDGED